MNGELPCPVRLQRLELHNLPAVAAVHCAAFPTSALSMLGAEAVRRYYEWQLVGQHQSVGLGAFVAGDLGGFCVGGVFRAKMSGYLRRNRWFLMARLARHPLLIAKTGFRDRLIAGLRILDVLPKPAASVSLYQDSDPHSFGILSIGVHPRYRGAGLGRLLMNEAEAIARHRGFRLMNLSVKLTNQSAIQFYEALDWQRRALPGESWNGEMIKCLDH